MSIIQKLQLKKFINKFYKIFGAELDRAPFTTKLRDLNSYDFLHDIQFDVLQILEVYENCFYEEAYTMHKWLIKFNAQINTLKETCYEHTC